MSRAAQQQRQQTQAQADQTVGQLKQAAQSITGEAGNIKDLTPEAKAAYANQLASGTAAGYGQGKRQAMDMAARTGSPAGLHELERNFTRGQTGQNALNTANAQQYFQNYGNNVAQQRANVYAMGVQPLESAYGGQTSALNSLNQYAYAPGAFSQIMAGLASGAGKALMAGV